MAIYTNSSGQQVYDYNGATFDAKTGQPISGTAVAPDPFATNTGSSITYGAVNTQPVATLSSSAGQDVLNNNIETLQRTENTYSGQNQYQYADTSGNLQTVSASSSDEAMKSATNIDPHSGVMLLRNVTNSPAAQTMVDDINNTVSRGGLTTNETTGLKGLQGTQDRITELATRSRLALEAQSYKEMDSYVAQLKEAQKSFADQLSAYHKEIAPLRQRQIELLSPTERERDLQKKLVSLRSEAEQFELQVRKDKQREFEGQTLGFAQGRASGIDRDASFAMQEMALKEKNLLLSLGLEQDARSLESKSLEQQIGFLGEDFDLQQKVQDKILAMEEDIYNKASNLQKESGKALADILDALSGVDPNSIPPASLQNLETLATRAGLPFDLVFQSLQAQYARQVFEDSLDAAKTSGSSGSSGSTSGSTGGTTGDTPTSVSSRAQQVIDGFASIGDFTLAEQAKIRDELFKMGFNSDTPPTWFTKYIQDQKRQSLLPDVIQSEWIKYRDGIVGGSDESSGGSSTGGVPSYDEV